MSATSVRPGRTAQAPVDAAPRAPVDAAPRAPVDAATADRVRRARLRAAVAARGIPLATILVSVGVVVLTFLAGKLAYRLRDIILMILAAGFLALVLNPLVVGLQRRWIRRRGQAVAVVTIWSVLVFAGLVAAFGYPLVHGVTHFSQRLPSYVAAAEHGSGWIGHLVRRFHLQAWVNRNAPKLQGVGMTLAKPALNVGKGAVSLLATLGTIFALLVLFLLEGPKMRRWLLELMPPAKAAYYTRVGATLTAGIVTAAAFIAYQQIENHVLNPVVMSRTVKINPLLVLLAILVGTSIGDWVAGAFGSFVAALVSIPVAGALQVIARELWQITGTPGPPDGEPAAGPQVPAGDRQMPQTPDDSGRQAGQDKDDAAAPVPAAVTDATPAGLA